MHLRAALAAALLGALLAPSTAAGQAPGWWADAKPTLVAGDLAGPVDFAVAPDGALWYVELYEGNVMRLDPSTKKSEVRWHVDVVNAFDERGLAGLALDPDFARNGVFYIYYTRPDPANESGGWNRLSRIEGGQEHILLDNITAAVHHNGGRIVFDQQGNLLLGVGENYLGDPAQDPDSVLGKILRMTRDGKPVEGNLKGLVFSLGHRNMYGLAIDPATGKLWETENSNWQRDEVNIIEAGKNYGYPVCEGFSLGGKDDPCPPQYEPPLLEFYHTKTAGPTGCAFFQGQFYWASWNEGSIHWLGKDASGAWADARVWDPLSNTVGRRSDAIGDIEPARDGRSLYYSNWSAIWRIDFPSLPAAPPPTPTPTPVVGAQPQATEKPNATPGLAPGLLVAALMAVALLRRR